MNVEGMCEHVYASMPPIDTFANYLLMGETLMCKTPTLPSKLLRITSKLNGRASAAAGQAGGALNTMAVLQSYQADQLKDLDHSKGLSPD